VLVPATMKLSGDWTWWVPRWLDRVLPRFDIQGDVGLPAPEYEPSRGDAGSDRREAGPVLVG
jgi:RND superfamily putative drug exporter